MRSTSAVDTSIQAVSAGTTAGRGVLKREQEREMGHRWVP